VWITLWSLVEVVVDGLVVAAVLAVSGQARA
jgi:hypothetical protein